MCLRSKFQTKCLSKRTNIMPKCKKWYTHSNLNRISHIQRDTNTVIHPAKTNNNQVEQCVMNNMLNHIEQSMNINYLKLPAEVWQLNALLTPTISQMLHSSWLAASPKLTKISAVEIRSLTDHKKNHHMRIFARDRRKQASKRPLNVSKTSSKSKAHSMKLKETPTNTQKPLKSCYTTRESNKQIILITNGSPNYTLQKTW